MSTLTAAEQRTFLIAMLCSEEGLSSVKIDFDKFCKMTGYKDSSARVTYHRIKRKIEASNPEELFLGNGKAAATGTSSQSPSEPGTPKKPRSPRVAKTPKSAAKAGKTPLKSEGDENTSPLKRELFSAARERSMSPSPVDCKKRVRASTNGMDTKTLKPALKVEGEGSTAFL